MCLPKEAKPLSASAKAKAALMISNDCEAVRGDVCGNIQLQLTFLSCHAFIL